MIFYLHGWRVSHVASRRPYWRAVRGDGYECEAPHPESLLALLRSTPHGPPCDSMAAQEELRQLRLEGL